MATQPSGTVTFLFTDLEGSTKLWERHPEAMRGALAHHDRLLREAITDNGGYIFKTVGDAFCAAFSSVTAAVAAALASQRALASHAWPETGPLRARMALHTGEAEERDGDYFGPPVNRVARLLAAGHGGQILASQATAEGLLGSDSQAFQLRDLGEHRLKDLARSEHVFQLNAPGLQANFDRLKSQPSPIAGAVSAVGASLIGLVSYQLESRSAAEGVGLGLLSPLSLFTGLKGLVLELSTYNENLLLAAGGVLLLVALGLGLIRWRRVRAQGLLLPVQTSRLGGLLANQRSVAFLAVAALIVLGAYGYQQYLWRVALPIPAGAVGIALTRDAAAASFRDQLQDSLFAQGSVKQVVVRELPIRFDASDTDKARALGRRIGAEAVIIYRVDTHPVDAAHRYVAYLVFTDPRVGLSLGSKPDATIAGATSAGNTPSVQFKNGVNVPVLQTGSLAELVDAAAGILSYNDDRIRDAIQFLESARASQPDSPDAGIVDFYLGTAYSLDNQTDKATAMLEATAGFYERKQQGGSKLGPQDELLLVMTYTERGRLAALQDQWDSALSWYQKAIGPRDDLLARAAGLERPSDVRAAYARLYSLMADAYRAQGKLDDQQFWQKRAADELAALAADARANDPYPLIQQGVVLFFAGNCQDATAALTQALALGTSNANAATDQGVVYLLQGRLDLAEEVWQNALSHRPNDVEARKLLALLIVDRAVSGNAFAASDLSAAKAQLREIIHIDPTNVDAYEQLATLDSLLARSALIDTTALAQGDELTVEKSQVLWPVDSARRQAALDALAALIEERRILASELQPGDAIAAAAVADAYNQRQDLLYMSLLSVARARVSATPAATPLAGEQSGAQILDDAAQIATWTDKVLAGPSASRVAKLRAWADLVSSNERVWGWYTFFAPDPTEAGRALQQYRTSVKGALDLASNASVGTTDEIEPLRSIYLSALFLVAAIDQDKATAASYQTVVSGLTSREQQERAKSTGHLESICRDERERLAGDAAATSGDLGSAQRHYAAAIAANPGNLAALLGVASVLFHQGDRAGAVAQARTATQYAGNDPAAWADLGRYSVATGDDSGARTAYEGFGSRLATQSPERQMASIRAALSDLSALVTADPVLAPHVQTILSVFDGFLSPLPDAEKDSFQYPALYAQLGRLALDVGSLKDGEAWLRRALDLDPHQPAAWADLVVAVIAEGRDATAVASGASAEIRDPLWAETADFHRPQLVALVSQEVSALEPRFPEQKEQLEAFKATIAAQAGT